MVYRVERLVWTGLAALLFAARMGATTASGWTPQCGLPMLPVMRYVIMSLNVRGPRPSEFMPYIVGQAAGGVSFLGSGIR